MLWAPIVSLALLAGDPQASVGKPARSQVGERNAKPVPKSAVIRSQQPTPKLMAADMPSPTEDPAAERDLLDLANQSRRRVGLPPLRVDGSLTDAARAHALLMVERAQLEHQFPGEPSLLERIAQVSPLRLDSAGENVAYHSSAEQAHDALMHSPPHRENLLDVGFNVAGVAAIWSEGRLYVVEDFVHELPSHSAEESDRLVSRAVHDARRAAGLPDLEPKASSDLDNAVCSLARQNRLSTHNLAGAANVRGAVTYAQGRPETLPAGAVQLLTTTSAEQFAVGTCFSRNVSNPAGIYWIAILLY